MMRHGFDYDTDSREQFGNSHRNTHGMMGFSDEQDNVENNNRRKIGKFMIK